MYRTQSYATQNVPAHMTDLTAVWVPTCLRLTTGSRGRWHVGKDVWRVGARAGNFPSGYKAYDSRPIWGITLPNDGPHES